jgi:hypothetical protein
MVEITHTPYEERNHNPVNRLINERLDVITQQAIARYVGQYATYEDGTKNDVLADRIRYEVMRRSQMGREIDVLEPARWTAYSAMLGVFSGAAAKLLTEKLTGNHSPLNGRIIQNTLIGTATAAAFAAVVTGGRVLSFARFQSGLYAGAQTALSLYNENLLTQRVDAHHPLPSHAEKTKSLLWQDRVQQEGQRYDVGVQH